MRLYCNYKIIINIVSAQYLCYNLDISVNRISMNIGIFLPSIISLSVAIASGIASHIYETTSNYRDPNALIPKKNKKNQITEQTIENAPDDTIREALKKQKLEQDIKNFQEGSKSFASVSLFFLSIISSFISINYVKNLINNNVFANNKIAASAINILLSTFTAISLRHLALQHTDYSVNKAKATHQSPDSIRRKQQAQEEQFTLALYQGLAAIAKELVEHILLYSADSLFKGPLQRFAESNLAIFIADTVAKSFGFAAFQAAHQLLYATTKSYGPDKEQVSGKKLAITSLSAFLLGTVSNITLGIEPVKNLLGESAFGTLARGTAQIALSILYTYVLSMVTDINREDATITLII